MLNTQSSMPRALFHSLALIHNTKCSRFTIHCRRCHPFFFSFLFVLSFSLSQYTWFLLRLFCCHWYLLLLMDIHVYPKQKDEKCDGLTKQIALSKKYSMSHLHWCKAISIIPCLLWEYSHSHSLPHTLCVALMSRKSNESWNFQLNDIKALYDKQGYSTSWEYTFHSANDSIASYETLNKTPNRRKTKPRKKYSREKNV